MLLHFLQADRLARIFPLVFSEAKNTLFQGFGVNIKIIDDEIAFQIRCRNWSFPTADAEDAVGKWERGLKDHIHERRRFAYAGVGCAMDDVCIVSLLIITFMWEKSDESVRLPIDQRHCQRENEIDVKVLSCG